jgi:membrane protease YdiL (CAAX protease family)
MRPLALALALALTAACSKPVPPARLDTTAPPMPREELARDRVTPTAGGMRNFVPGAYQLSSGQTAEGVALAGLATAELGVGLALYFDQPEGQRDFKKNPGLLVPFVALQDTMVYSWSDALLDQQRARRLPFTPQDTTRELVAAPFNVQVLRRPAVWGGIIGLVGAGYAATTLLEGGAPVPSSRPVNLYGARLSPAAGHPLATLNSAFLFEHVALSEEAAFRGVVQSGLVRWTGSETGGWALGSAAFGALHAANVVAMPKEDRAEYLLVAVPYITVVGSYLGLTYRWSDYSLAAPVALHFWYDLLIVALDVASSPEQNFYSVGYDGRF